MIGPADAQRRAPTVSLEVQESSNDLAAQLAKRNVMAAGGDFYGGRPLKAMNVDTDLGVLRLSFVHYNTKSEVDHLISTLDDVI